MSDQSNHGWPRGTVVAGADNTPTGYEPRFAGSIGTSRRGTVYATTPQEERGPGFVSQEQATGGDLNTVRYTDQGNKSLSVRAAPSAQPWVFLDPTGNNPIGREPTVKDTVNVPGVGIMKVREALALGVLTSDALQVQANPMATYDAMVKRAAGQEAPKATEKTEAAPQATDGDQALQAALQADYNATVGDLTKAMEAVGVSVDGTLNVLASGDASSLADAATKLSAHMGADRFNDTVEALTLRVYDAAERALPQGVDFDAVMDVIEGQADQRRWSSAFVSYLRNGDATLIQQMVREAARGLGR
jgi:hypothetical protein